MTSLDEIKILLKTNKERLYKEVTESKEVVQLIKKSMKTTLSEEEKLRVK